MSSFAIENLLDPSPQPEDLAMRQLLLKQLGELQALELEHLLAKQRMEIIQMHEKVAIKTRHEEEIKQLEEAQADARMDLGSESESEPASPPQQQIELQEAAPQNPLIYNYFGALITYFPQHYYRL